MRAVVNALKLTSLLRNRDPRLAIRRAVGAFAAIAGVGTGAIFFWNVKPPTV
jgi:hypothetical protein